MNSSMLLLLPIMTQILMTFLLVVWLGYAKLQALKAGKVTLEKVSLSSEGWPDNVKKISNNFNNQFQLPVLFYILCILALLRGHADMTLVVLAWIFVLFRLAHSFIHTGSNNVRRRFNAYLGCLVTLFIMWGYVLYRFWITL